MKFHGTTLECLAEYAEPLPFEGSRNRRRFYGPIASFTGVSEETIGKWLRKEAPLAPNGIILMRAAFFFEVLGGEVKELIMLRRLIPLNYQLAELIAFGVVSIEDVQNLLEYTNNNAIVGMICRGKRGSPDREKALRSLVDDAQVDLKGRRQEATEKVRRQFSELFGRESLPDLATATSEVVAVSPPRDAVRQETLRRIEGAPTPAQKTAPVRSTAAAEPEELRSIGFDREAMLRMLAYNLLAIGEILEVVVKEFTPAERDFLRTAMMGPDESEIKGQRLFEITNNLQALSGERAREKVIAGSKFKS